jgi:DNA replication and repair protein RecF
VRVVRLTLRDFRSYSAADVHLGEEITVVHGRNGAGKTNLLEALYVGCTGRSWRASNDAELIRFGADVARVELSAEAEDGGHLLEVGFERGARRRVRADGVALERLGDAPARPLAAVFVPDRLELVKAGPSVRRAHVDQVVAAMWPARASTRRAYARALAQRNALLTRGSAGREPSLDAWDVELARHGHALMTDRAAAVEAIAGRFAALAVDLGLDGDARVAYRPRSRASTVEALGEELRERRARDLDRGFTAHGPHRDEIALTRAERDLRSFGSQGQQRLAVLALLLAEREAIADERGAAPLMLLDDALSELDGDRRERVVAWLGERGQSVITTTDAGLVPIAEDRAARLAVADGAVLAETTAS